MYTMQREKNKSVKLRGKSIPLAIRTIAVMCWKSEHLYVQVWVLRPTVSLAYREPEARARPLYNSHFKVNQLSFVLQSPKIY